MKGFVHNSVTRFHEVVSPLLGKAKNKCEEISPKIKSFKQKIGINIVDNNDIIISTIFPSTPMVPVGLIFAGGAWVRKKNQRKLIEKQRREAQFCWKVDGTKLCEQNFEQNKDFFSRIRPVVA